MGKPKRYILVYQSGHGDVWCNCTTHIHMNGNCAGSAPLGVKEEGVIVEIYFTKCDCKFWSQWNIPVGKPDAKITDPELMKMPETTARFTHMTAKGQKECIRGRKCVKEVEKAQKSV